MVRITCPHCQSRLNAKDELIGQTRNCPSCGQPVLITAPPPPAEYDTTGSIPLDDGPVEQHIEVPESSVLRQHTQRPERLVRHYRYLILDRERLLATWENNGQGWMIRSGPGFVTVSRNTDKLPTQGTFELVELRLTVTEAGLRLHGILTYRLARRWALPDLAKSDEAILRKVEGFGSLNKSQKFALCHYVRDQFMREVWTSISEVHDYLTNGDYHSPGIDIPQESS